MQLSQKQKYFLVFFLHFQNLDSILNIFKIRMIIIADIFLNLRAANNMVKYVPKNSRFRGPFDK